MFNREMILEECVMHWIVLLFAMIGVFLVFCFRKNRKTPLYITIADGMIMVVLSFLGGCMTEVIWTIVGVLVMGTENFFWNREE